MSDSTVRSEFENVVIACLQAIVGPLAKYVVENYDSLKETTEDELTDVFIERMNIPRPTVSAPSMPIGMAGLTPNIGSGMPPGFSLNIKETTPRKRTVKKDAPVQVWLDQEQYESEIRKGSKICGYVFSRSKLNKDKFCGARVDDATHSDEREWRCVTCAGKKGDIMKKIPKPINGISPDKVFPGLSTPGTPHNVLPIPSIPLPQMPPPMSNLPKMPPPIPVPSLPTGPAIGIPSFAIPSIPKAITPPPVKEPEPEPEPDTSISVTKLHPGLSDGQYFADNADTAGIIFKVDPVEKALVAIGKYANEIPETMPSGYMDSVVELSSQEQAIVARYNLKYKFHKAPVLPNLVLPSLPMFK